MDKHGASFLHLQVIAQIETDKVTIDCKAMESGVMAQIMVQIGAVVKPGQVVASVTAGAAAPSGPSTAAPAAPTASAAPLHAAAAGSHGARAPSIHFPARRTASGERISDLPAEKQEQLLGAHHAAPASPPSPLPVSQPAVAAVPAAPKPKVVTTFLTSEPVRRGLTAREIELINSGGA